MCGPRQLFFQCSPEMPKGWTPLEVMPEKKHMYSRGKSFTSISGAKVKFCVTQHLDILYDPESLLFPHLPVLTRLVSTPEQFHYHRAHAQKLVVAA